MSRVFAAVALSGVMALTGPVFAAEGAKAELSSVKGAVQISQGGKIVTAKPGALRAGDRVIAGTGEAKLAYADGCVVTLKPRSMATIADVSPCAAGQGLVTSGSASAQTWDDMTAGEWVGAFLAIGGLLYGIGSLLSNGNDTAKIDDSTVVPVSP